jgi:hypothetical protein
MIIIYTFKDKKGEVRLDYGVDTKTDQMVILPPELLDCDAMGIYYHKDGYYCAEN